MLLAWATTEVIRYTYFALNQFNAVPGVLHWLRYSAFLVLYPIGISSEVAMMVQALIGPAADLAAWYPYVLVAILLGYIPGEFYSILLGGFCLLDPEWLIVTGRIVHPLYAYVEAAPEADWWCWCGEEGKEGAIGYRTSAHGRCCNLGCLAERCQYI